MRNDFLKMYKYNIFTILYKELPDMTFIKRGFALLLAFLMIFALSACGGKDNTGEEGGDNTYMEGGTDSQKALFGDLTGTKLRVGDSVAMDQWEIDFYKQFEKETGMKVEIEPLESAELSVKIAQAVASGDERNYFDVAVVVNSTILNMIYANLIIPMDQYLDKSDPVWTYSYSDNGIFSPDVYKIDGSIYGAPSHGYHETFIFYNKSYFEEMMAPDPWEEYYLKDNWTFETFMDTCKAVTKKGTDGSVEVAAWATWNYFSFASAAGNDAVAQDDKGKWDVIIDQPNGMAGLNLLYECAKNGWLYTKSSGYEEFVNRKIAMIIEKPSSAMGSTDAYERMSDEIGIVPLPKMNKEQEKYICPLTVSGYAIASCSKNPAGAAAYIYYHRIAEMRRDESEWGQKNIRRFLNDEAMARRAEYLKNCEFSVPFLDGLTGWYADGGRQSFLNIIFKDGTNPAVAVDSLKPIIKDCLRKTVG